MDSEDKKAALELQRVAVRKMNASLREAMARDTGVNDVVYEDVRTLNLDEHRKLISSIYALLRDHLPMGVLERVVENVQAEFYEEPHTLSLTDPFLALKSREIVTRLLSTDTDTLND